MNNTEPREQSNKKLFLINSFLHTCSLKSNNNPNDILKYAVSNYFLQAVVLELIIKILYELDQKDTAPFTHNILKIFNKLNQNTKDHLISMHEKARMRHKQQFIKIDWIHSKQISHLAAY